MIRLLSCLACCVVCASAAQPQVSNRSAQSVETGYRPADGANVEMNPPSLTWVREKDAATYIVQWAVEPKFKNPQTVSNLAFCCYTHNAVLPAGKYYWRYAFKTAKQEISGWSTTRSFTIDGKAVPFPLPSAEERRALLPAGHPRLFVRSENLSELRSAAQGNAKKRFDELRAQADKLIGADLTPEPRNPGTASNKTNTMLLQNWWANREQALRACTEAETVAFVFLMTGEEKYGAEARKRLLDLAAWDPAGETNFKRNCEAAKPLLHRIARVYDWCYPVLSRADRGAVYAAVRQRIHDAWVSGEVGEGIGSINNPYNSHGNRTFHKIGESGIVFLGEMPEADLWLDFALNKFYACYPVWSDSDGGWHEGLSYWAGYMSKIVWWLDAIDVAFGIDGMKKPFFSHVGDFALYLAPPGSPNMGFGDLSYNTPAAGWGGFMDYFTRSAAGKEGFSNAAQWQWWEEQWKMSSSQGVLGFLYEARLKARPAAEAPKELPKTKVFRGIGIASLHTTLVNSSEDVHLLFKSSPFGSLSHGFNPQNAFQLNAYGECLLPACVYRDWYGTAFHYQWVHQTISQNAVLVNHKGQVTHSPKQGGIVDERHGDGWSYVRGDATAAYDGVLRQALRHVLFTDSGLIILMDELEASQPSTFQFMLHGLAAFEVQQEAQRLSLQKGKAGLQALYVAEKPLQFKQWDGYEPKPLRGNFPNQWHVEASTTTQATKTFTFTVLAPYKGTSAPALSARSWDEPGVVGLEVNRGDSTTLVAFRKSDGGKAVISTRGLKLEGPVSVMLKPK